MDDAVREMLSAGFSAMREDLRSIVREELDSHLAPTRADGERDGYMSVERVAAMLEVAPETVRSWIKDHLLAAVRLPGGREYRILRSDLDACLGRVEAGERPPIDIGEAVAKMKASYMKPRRRRDEPDDK